MTTGDEKRFLAATLVRSGAGRTDRQRKTLLGLNLKRVRQTVIIPDTPANRGMLYKVNHLIKVSPFNGTRPPSARERAALKYQKPA